MRNQTNKIKKLFCFVLTTMLLCSLLAGCGKAPAPAADEASSAVASSAPSVSEAPVSEPESVAESVPEDAEYVMGTRTTTGFTSEWMGIEYTLPEGFVMATDEEIASTMELGADAMYEDKETGKKMIDLAKVTSVYEMMASSADGANIVLMTEKVAIAGMDANVYMLALKQQLSATTLSPVLGEQATMEIAGKQFETLAVEMETSGVTVGQLYCVSKQGDRMVCSVLSFLDEAQKEALLAGFSAL